MSEIELPYKFEPRWYQRPAWEKFDEGFKRILLVHHRRAGKDVNCWNLLIRNAFLRVGVYFYFLPTFAQARRVIWEGITFSGQRFLHYIPKELIDGKPNETQMRVRLANGSLIQLVGSDNIDSIVGTNPVGCIFSEYSLQDPRGWDFIRPVLTENGGWAVFNGTPRGKHNHMHRMFVMAQQVENSGQWWVDHLGVDRSKVLSEDDIQSERDSGMAEELIQQEYYCSFEGGMEGAIYVDQMERMRTEERITDVPHLPELPVWTAWDIGLDTTSVVFFQQPQTGIVRIIDYYEAKDLNLPHYIGILDQKASQLGYRYAEHIFPWDLKRQEWDDGWSREQSAKALGLKVRIAQKGKIEDGINAVQMMLAHSIIDAHRCDRLVQAMFTYRRELSKRHGELLPRPVHDWSSHPCDAMRYLAVGRTQARLNNTRDRYVARQQRNRLTGATWMSG